MSKSLRHYRVLDKQLRKHVDDEISKSLLAGLDYVKAGSKPEVKAQWAYEVMERMDRLLDEGAPLDQLGIRRPHQLDDTSGNAEEKGLLEPEQDPMARGATEHATQHVATPLVRGQDPVAEQKRAGARVVSDDT